METDAARQMELLSDLVNEYYQADISDGGRLVELIKKITGNLFYLETVRAEIHDRYETKVFNLVKEGHSVARAINEANVEIPEMYQLRRILDAGYRITDAIRTNISFIKSEMQNIKQ